MRYELRRGFGTGLLVERESGTTIRFPLSSFLAQSLALLTDLRRTHFKVFYPFTVQKSSPVPIGNSSEISVVSQAINACS